MSHAIRVEVRVSGALGGDLLDMLAELEPRAVPRHTVLTVDGEDRDGRDGLVGLLHVLDRAGIELDGAGIAADRAGIAVDRAGIRA